MRLSFCVQLVVLIVLGCFVYNTANKYQLIETNVRQLDTKTEQEYENIRVLQAEWAFLTAPVRLEKIARENFQLEALDGKQFVAIADIPLRDLLNAQEAETRLAQNNAAPSTAAPAAAARPSLPSPQALPQLTATSVSLTGGQE